MKPIIFTILMCIAAGAAGDVITQCKDGKGHTTLTNKACKAGESASVIVVDPKTADSSGLRQWAGRNPADLRDIRLSPAGQTTPPAPTIDPVACGNAERIYNFEAGYRYSRANLIALRLDVLRACGH